MLYCVAGLITMLFGVVAIAAHIAVEPPNKLAIAPLWQISPKLGRFSVIVGGLTPVPMRYDTSLSTS